MLYLLDLISTGLFAFIGARLASAANASLLGVFISALLMATGGGTTREILLRSESIFWLDDLFYVAMVVFGLLAALLLAGGGYERRVVIRILERLATTVFVVVGVSAAILAECDWLFVPLMGVLTGLGGGIIRDAIFNVHTNALLDKKLSRMVFIISIVAAISVHLGFHPADVLGVLLIAYLSIMLCFEKSAQYPPKTPGAYSDSIYK